jgi:hypothetical protein
LPWQSRRIQRSQKAGRMPAVEHRPPTIRSPIGAIYSIKNQRRALTRLSCFGFLAPILSNTNHYRTPWSGKCTSPSEFQLRAEWTS